MKFLDSQGLKVVLNRIKSTFATKAELSEVKKRIGGGTEFEEKITMKAKAYEEDLFFNFYKKGNVIKVFQIINKETLYSSYVPDNFLPKGFGGYDSFIIGKSFDLYYRDKQEIPSLVIKKDKSIEVTGGPLYVDQLKRKGFYGEIFVGEYFTN